MNEIARLNALALQSSDILPIAARKEEVMHFLDRLELLMVTVGTKASIFGESLSPALSWGDSFMLTYGQNLDLQHGVLRKSRDEQLDIPA